AIYENFNRQVSATADKLANQLSYEFQYMSDANHAKYKSHGPRLDDVATTTNGAVRVVGANGMKLDASANAPSWGRPLIGEEQVDGWRIATRRAYTYNGGPNV